jgi:hypothetical protein
MNSDKWTTLTSWFFTTGQKSPEIPAEVKDALETLVDERQSEDEEEEEEN